MSHLSFLCRMSDVDNLKWMGFNNKHLILLSEKLKPVTLCMTQSPNVFWSNSWNWPGGQLRLELSHGIRMITAQWALCKYYESHLESTCLIIGSAVRLYYCSADVVLSPSDRVRQPSDRGIAKRMCAALHRRWKIETTCLKKHFWSQA